MLTAKRRRRESVLKRTDALSDSGPGTRAQARWQTGNVALLYNITAYCKSEACMSFFSLVSIRLDHVELSGGVCIGGGCARVAAWMRHTRSPGVPTTNVGVAAVSPSPPPLALRLPRRRAAVLLCCCAAVQAREEEEHVLDSASARVRRERQHVRGFPRRSRSVRRRLVLGAHRLPSHGNHHTL